MQNTCSVILTTFKEDGFVDLTQKSVRRIDLVSRDASAAVEVGRNELRSPIGFRSAVTATANTQNLTLVITITCGNPLLAGTGASLCSGLPKLLF
jgi:hypothetical protein